MVFKNQPLLALPDTAHCGRAGRRPGRGYTLIELIMVIVIMGVLAAVAAPKIFNSGDFYARGFHDETLSILRYAQKAAVAQRRMVCVTLTLPEPASAKLSIASVAASGTCDISLMGPNANCPGGPSISAYPNAQQGCIQSKSGVWYSTAPASVSFNGLGQSVTSAAPTVPISQTIRINTAEGVWGNVIVVEGETGYVHD